MILTSTIQIFSILLSDAGAFKPACSHQWTRVLNVVIFTYDLLLYKTYEVLVISGCSLTVWARNGSNATIMILCSDDQSLLVGSANSTSPTATCYQKTAQAGSIFYELPGSWQIFPSPPPLYHPLPLPNQENSTAQQCLNWIRIVATQVYFRFGCMLFLWTNPVGFLQEKHIF